MRAMRGCGGVPRCGAWRSWFGKIALTLLALAAFFYVIVFVVSAIGTARVPLRFLLERAKEVAAALVAAALLADPRMGHVRADRLLACLERPDDLRRGGRRGAWRGAASGTAPRTALGDFCAGPAVVLDDARTGSQFIVASLAVHQRVPLAAPRLARNGHINQSGVNKE